MIRIAVCDDEQHVLDEISQMTATYMRSCNFNLQWRGAADGDRPERDVSDRISGY